MRKKIQLYIDGEDKKLIQEASKLVALSNSSFCKTSAIKEARKLLKNNQEEFSQ